jgi:hypothetical protein
LRPRFKGWLLSLVHQQVLFVGHEKLGGLKVARGARWL